MEWINFDSNILTDITNFFLVVLGISVTLFTVIYSFIVNKRDEVIKINDELIKGNSNPYLQQKKSFNILYIKNFKRWNKHLIGVALMSLLSFLLSFWVNRFMASCKSQLICFKILIILFLLVLIYLFFMIIFMYVDFNKRTKL